MKRKTFSLILIFHFLLIFLNSEASIYTDQECLICHGKSDISQITHDGTLRSLFINPENWLEDIHHKGQITCVDCHINANPYVHFREGLINVDCARCHPEEAEEYLRNVHLTFTPNMITPNKELPLCHHCHTNHYVLRHDNPRSSIHEDNVGATCANCHAEVMVKEILKGTSLGKISGHRKGDLGEKFDMNVCINCHYEDAAHGAKRAYKVFCSRCHNVRSKANPVIGPTHLDSQKWIRLNYLSGSMIILFLIGVLGFAGCKSRKNIRNRIRRWYNRMKIEKQEPSPPEITNQKKNNWVDQ